MNPIIIQSRLFLASLVLLLINDFFLKFAWPGIISGKLSDFAGISLLSLLLFSVLPQYKIILSTLILVIFCWWKSEWSESFITLVQQAGLPHFNRVVDLSDLIALSMVPVCYRYARAREQGYRQHVVDDGQVGTTRTLDKFFRAGIVVLAVFAITATSQAPGSYRSEFTIGQQPRSKVTDLQIVAIVDRILAYYGYKCTKNCQSPLHREYQDSRGTVIYSLDTTTGLVRIKQTISPDQGMIDLFKRDDIKHMSKMREQIVLQFKQENSRVDYKVEVEPGRYSK